MAGPELNEAVSLRYRNISEKKKDVGENAREAVLRLNALEEKTEKADCEKKTFGRTPDGTVFTVPATHDMVSQLLSPSEPKNVSDIFVLTVLTLQISLLWILPNKHQISILGAIFIFWRASYNLGIGWLLQKQSKQNTLVRWAKKSKLFVDAQSTPYPRLQAFIKSELERKIAHDYAFETAPIEYNTWLMFRRIVDLILMCDFCSYMLFAVACAGKPHGEFLLITVSRWVIGMTLLLFNLWVKLDAHRVVKDYAWYWGDFFFLVDQDLTFDGVFEMAPHPMYSIGYIGYYGISLMAASHKVMFISIFAHAAQFAFLVLVENPHIEKTYNAPPPRRQTHEIPQNPDERPKTSRVETNPSWTKTGIDKPPATHNLLGPQNFDFYRITDTSTTVIQILLFLLTIVTPTDTFYQSLFISSAIISRLWYSAGIGYLLNRQSVKKKWTRHFLKHGESTGEAWRQWRGTYYMSMTICYTTFAAAAWKMYKAPESWDDGTALLKHTIGLCLVALQTWVAVSVYEQLGEFGWFFGDFFFDHSPKLTYGGIYRFLNNPERVLGLAGVWGVALITNSKAMFALALLSHTLSFGFIQLVERPHMQKLYGRHLRQDSGLVKTLKRSLPPPLRQWQDNMDKMLDEALDVFEEWMDARRSSPTQEPTEAKYILSKDTAGVSIVKVDGLDSAKHVSEYSVRIKSEQTEVIGLADADGTPMTIAYGSPIYISWSAPMNHDKLDWIGLYDVSRNASREVTRVSSQGRWTATNPGEYDVLTSEDGIISSNVKSKRVGEDGQEHSYLTGEMIFHGEKLWWRQGVFEFRMHHAGKHSVLATSQPFEIRIPRFSEEDLDLVEPMSHLDTIAHHNEGLIRKEIEKELLPIIQKCFERDPDIAPATSQEPFGGLVEREGKYAQRVVYAIQHMFGIEFAPQVVKADGKIENLAWRIWEAKRVLAPYSMSKSRGTSTPT